MMLGKDFDYIELSGDRLVIGAATPTGKILSFCKSRDIGGFEYVAKLPGTLGGMLAMNAGVKSFETFNSLAGVKTDKGFFQKEDIEHGYRYAKLPGVALEAVFEIERGFDPSLAKMPSRLSKKPAPSSRSASVQIWSWSSRYCNSPHIRSIFAILRQTVVQSEIAEFHVKERSCRKLSR